MNKCFRKYWDEKVKPLATKCAEGIELIGELERATTEAEKEAVQKQMKATGKKDWYAVWYISQMIFDVEHALCDDRNPALRIAEVAIVLGSEAYYRDVFKGEECEESQNYRELGEKLGEALSLAA